MDIYGALIKLAYDVEVMECEISEASNTSIPSESSRDNEQKLKKTLDELTAQPEIDESKINELLLKLNQIELLQVMIHFNDERLTSKKNENSAKNEANKETNKATRKAAKKAAKKVAEEAKTKRSRFYKILKPALDLYIKCSEDNVNKAINTEESYVHNALHNLRKFLLLVLPVAYPKRSAIGKAGLLVWAAIKSKEIQSYLDALSKGGAEPIITDEKSKKIVQILKEFTKTLFDAEIEQYTDNIRDKIHHTSASLHYELEYRIAYYELDKNIDEQLKIVSDKSKEYSNYTEPQPIYSLNDITEILKTDINYSEKIEKLDAAINERVAIIEQINTTVAQFKSAIISWYEDNIKSGLIGKGPEQTLMEYVEKHIDKSILNSSTIVDYQKDLNERIANFPNNEWFALTSWVAPELKMHPLKTKQLRKEFDQRMKQASKINDKTWKYSDDVNTLRNLRDELANTVIQEPTHRVEETKKAADAASFKLVDMNPANLLQATDEQVQSWQDALIAKMDHNLAKINLLLQKYDYDLKEVQSNSEQSILNILSKEIQEIDLAPLSSDIKIVDAQLPMHPDEIMDISDALNQQLDDYTKCKERTAMGKPITDSKENPVARIINEYHKLATQSNSLQIKFHELSLKRDELLETIAIKIKTKQQLNELNKAQARANELYEEYKKALNSEEKNDLYSDLKNHIYWIDKLLRKLTRNTEDFRKYYQNREYLRERYHLQDLRDKLAITVQKLEQEIPDLEASEVIIAKNKATLSDIKNKFFDNNKGIFNNYITERAKEYKWRDRFSNFFERIFGFLGYKSEASRRKDYINLLQLEISAITAEDLANPNMKETTSYKSVIAKVEEGIELFSPRVKDDSKTLKHNLETLKHDLENLPNELKNKLEPTPIATDTSPTSTQHMVQYLSFLGTAFKTLHESSKATQMDDETSVLDQTSSPTSDESLPSGLDTSPQPPNENEQQKTEDSAPIKSKKAHRSISFFTENPAASGLVAEVINKKSEMEGKEKHKSVPTIKRR